MAAENEVGVVDEVQKIDALGEVGKEGRPAAGTDDIALTHICEEGFERFLFGKERLDRAERLHAAHLTAVAADAVVAHVDVLDRAAVSVLAAHDRSFCDHRAAQVSAEREIKGISKIRGSPELGDGGAFRVVDERARPRKMIRKDRERKSGTGEDLSVENALFVSGDQCLHGKADTEDLRRIT